MADSATRPNVATIFGILDLVFGVLGLSNVTHLNSMNAWPGTFYNIVLLAGVALAVLLLAAGFFLLTDRGIALKLNRYYAYGAIALTVIRTGFPHSPGRYRRRAGGHCIHHHHPDLSCPDIVYFF